mgnify:FL=1|tara:strand:- start:153 stop:1031 length:879 start_codon:yes stop_codon:yes gene_type:complete
MASEPVLQVELNVIGQELSYNGIPKPIPQTYWTDTLVPLLYPVWDTDKDKLISFYYYSNGTYTAKRRKYVMNFKTNTNEWKDYEMEQVASSVADTFKEKLVEGWYAIDAIENIEFQNELGAMYAKANAVSPLSVRLARDFLLAETDWVYVEDSPVDADTKAMYTAYRQKLRDIPETVEFSTNVEGTKFPISPDFYNKIYKTENAGKDYLATDDQFLPLASHYLKRYRDRMAHYLLTKSFTERSYFDTFIAEYNNVKVLQSAHYVPEYTTEAKKAFLDKLLAQCQTEIDNLGS